MDIWINWISLVAIFMMALISPGPDFVIAVRNSVLYSRKIGLLTALGFALGVCVHLAYTLVGLALLISKSIILFQVIKYAGAAYLIYIGIKALRSQGFEKPDGDEGAISQAGMSSLSAIYSGFLTNVLNPKATLFFLAIFSQFIGVDTAFNVQLLYAATLVVMTGLWFSVVALILTNPKIKAIFLKFAKWIDKICGILLIGLATKIIFSKAST